MLRLLTASCLLATIFAGAASAAVAPLFDRTQARAGERVRIDMAYAPKPNGIELYLIPLQRAPQYVLGNRGLPAPAPGRPPADPRLVPLGSPKRAGTSSARLTLRVPKLAPGRYTIVVWCKPCGNDHWAMATPSYVANPRAVLRIVD
jgi:hypothetical protein